LVETVKWGIPVYRFDGKNIVGFAGFKNYVGLWFYQGVFLEDSQSVLLNAQEGVTKAMRQWRFSSIEEVKENENLILQYFNEAILNQQNGRELLPKKKGRLVLAEELVNALAQNSKLKNAFEVFTESKRREFSDYIFEAKRDSTKLSRIEKIRPMIMKGEGLNDRYK